MEFKLNFEPIVIDFADEHRTFYKGKARKKSRDLYLNDDGSVWSIDQFKNFPFVIDMYNENDLPLIDIRELVALQGDLKEMIEPNYYKFKASVMLHGFKFPFYKWTDKSGKHWIVDGHGRQIILLTQTPHDRKGKPFYEFPVVDIPARTIKEAKELLVSAAGDYNTTTQAGFDKFTYDLDPFVKQIAAFDGIYEITGVGNTKGKPPKKNVITTEFTTKFTCPNCGYEHDGK